MVPTNVRFPKPDLESLAILAERMAKSQGRDVTVSDVVRLLVAAGIDANPISDRERTAFRARKGKMAPVRKLSGLRASEHADLVSLLMERRERDQPAIARPRWAA